MVAQWWRTCLILQEMWVQSLDQEDSLEKKMATHCNILAWEIHGQRATVHGVASVRHSWSDGACTHIILHSHIIWFPVAQMVEDLPAMQEARIQSLGQEDTLEKGMATHSSILAWRQRGLAGYSLWRCKKSDTTEQLTPTHIIWFSNHLGIHICEQLGQSMSQIVGKQLDTPCPLEPKDMYTNNWNGMFCFTR